MKRRFYQNGGPIDHLSKVDFSAANGKTVIVTGGSSGLGAAYVKTFVDSGAFVVNGDINPPTTEQHTSKSLYIKCDASSWADQVVLFKAAITNSPTNKIDIVIANAGIYGPDILDGIEEEEPPEPNLDMFNVDLFGVIYTTKLAAFYFRKQEGTPSEKCLILVGSIMGYLDSEGSTIYAVSKHAVRGLMAQMRRKGVMRVNSLAPWFIPTPGMHPSFRDSVLAKFEAQGLGFAHEEDAAAAVMRIATDKAINGRSIAIIPRKLSSTGYIDLNLDDFMEGSVCDILQRAASSLDYPGVNKY